MEDRRLTVKQIAANAGIFIGSMDTILHDDLKMRKSCAIMSSDRLVRGRGSFGLFSHDVRPSLKCRTHERTFFTSKTPFGLTQPKERPRLLQQLSRFSLLPFPRKKIRRP